MIRILNFRLSSCLILVAGLVAVLASGCCGPRGCGVGCGNVTCNDCDGCYAPVRGGGPLAAIQNARRGLICGSGCGETYVGEWISTPPDCQDPCCNSQFVGGAVKARPFCRAGCRTGCRLCLLKNLYGKRNCTGDQSSASCGCGETSCGAASCDTCSTGDYVTSEYAVDDYTEIGHEVAPGPVQGSCGCATCRGPESPMATRLAKMGRTNSRDAITARARQIRQR